MGKQAAHSNDWSRLRRPDSSFTKSNELVRDQRWVIRLA